MWWKMHHTVWRNEIEKEQIRVEEQSCGVSNLNQKFASTFLPFTSLVGRKLSHSEPCPDVSFLNASSWNEKDI